MLSQYDCKDCPTRQQSRSTCDTHKAVLHAKSNQVEINAMPVLHHMIDSKPCVWCCGLE